MVLTQVRHALEPLSADEIVVAMRILREEQGLTERHRIVQIALHEPPKAAVLAGQDTDREAFVIVIDRDRQQSHEAVVSVTGGRVRQWKEIVGSQPPFTFEEFAEAEQACINDPGYREAVAKRGITDLSLLMVDPWSAGAYEDSEGRRLTRALTWVRASPDDNGYAHPLEGLLTVVDLHAGKVVKIEDHGVVQVPMSDGNYIPKYVGMLRDDIKPISISQPEGPSWEIDGYHVSWQRWKFRVGFTPREGLVLHQVTYADGGRDRSVLYRASVAEMVVPYGDPSPTHRRKNAFDVGEYNIGLLANSLELGCDCLGLIHYFDATLSDPRGAPYTLRNAICLHEEDFGMGWKHTDFRTEAVEVRRAGRLVVSFVSTVGNYEYGFFWYFYQDGSIEHEVKMTGILSTGALMPGETRKYGQRLTPDGLYAPIHQHYFSYRLDMDVDGTDNSIYEIHAETEPAGPDNPLHNAFYFKVTQLRTEQEAQQHVDPMRGRIWKIVNNSVKNWVGEPVGYRLVPGTNVGSLVGDTSSVSRRAGFMTKHLWVTPHAEDERFPAGDYPNQHEGGDGLPRWTEANRNIEDTDLVLWYSLGSHHPPRLEDWPVMPVQRIGFMLQPMGFFPRSPAIDVPPEKMHANGHSPNGASCH
jgi:primary-amine oxidase